MGSTYDFAALAASYDEWYATPRGAAYDRLEKEMIRAALRRAGATGGGLLDVGCGTGHFSEFFAALGFEVVGVDISLAMLERARILDEEAGYSPETAPRGFSFRDDNCALLTPEMYEFFGYPILKGIFERYAPDPGDRRYQHSDSDMAHILPVLGRLDLTGVNFGPTLSVSQIREHLPRAVIYGQLAPFTFSRNEEEKIVAEFLRDFDQAREHRGLVFATAGSINNGSRLTGMRLIMSAIQHFGRYDQ